MTSLDIPPPPLSSVADAYRALCAKHGRAPADVPPMPHRHQHAIDPRHAQQVAVVLASQAVDRARRARAAADAVVERAERHYAAMVAQLRGMEGA